MLQCFLKHVCIFLPIGIYSEVCLEFEASAVKALNPQFLLNLECFILKKGCAHTETLSSLEQNT